MSSLTVGVISAVTTFMGSLLGMGLQRVLPGHSNKEEGLRETDGEVHGGVPHDCQRVLRSQWRL